MTGTQTIDIKFKHYSYHIELAQKITILRGDSGTGKTTLIEDLQELDSNNKGELVTSAPVISVPDRLATSKIELVILTSENSIICLDEGLINKAKDTIMRAINKSNNYFLIVTRDPLDGVSFGPSAIKILHTDENKLHTLQPRYPAAEKINKPDIIICEDEASGYQFFSLFSQRSNTVLTAKGKSNVYSLANRVSEQNPSKQILIIADGSAFGSCLIKEMMLMHQRNPKISLYLPESFEYILLYSPIFDQDTQVQLELNSPMSHIDSSYISTEQYFTEALTLAMKRLGQTYSKSKLNPCFYDLCCYKGKDCPGKVKDRSHTKQDELLHRIGKLDLSNI